MNDVVLVGSGGVGKSTFWRRLQNIHAPLDGIAVVRGASRSGAARGPSLLSRVNYELSTDLDVTMLELSSEDRSVKTVIYTTPGQPFVRQARRLRETYAGNATGLVFMFSADEDADRDIQKQLDLIRREKEAYKTFTQRSILIVLNKIDTVDIDDLEVRKHVEQQEALLREFFAELAEEWSVAAFGPIRTSFAPDGIATDTPNDAVKKDIHSVLSWVRFVVGKRPCDTWEDMVVDNSHRGGKVHKVFGLSY